MLYALLLSSVIANGNYVQQDGSWYVDQHDDGPPEADDLIADIKFGWQYNTGRIEWEFFVKEGPEAVWDWRRMSGGTATIGSAPSAGSNTVENDLGGVTHEPDNPNTPEVEKPAWRGRVVAEYYDTLGVYVETITYEKDFADHP